MRKIIALLALMGLMLAACGAPSETPGSSSNGTVPAVSISGDGSNISASAIIKLPAEFTGASTRAIGDWTGEITVTGEGVLNGSHTTYLTRYNVDNGGFLHLNLPVGDKNIEVELTVETEQGVLEYAGSIATTIFPGENSIDIIINRTNGGSGDIDVTIKEEISISIKEIGVSYAVAGATVTFRNGADVIETVTTDANGAAIAQLTVQATDATAYTYEIKHNLFYTLSGTIKVRMGLIVLDGATTSVLEINKMITRDTVIPEISNINLTVLNNSNQTINATLGKHDVIFTPSYGLVLDTDAFKLHFAVSDDESVASVSTNSGTLVNEGGNNYYIQFPAGQAQGNFGLTITVTDVAGNTKTYTYNYTVTYYMP